MLRELYVKNLALIEELRLEFAPGFSVFTGETGAGKSILLQAVNLLAGRRAGGGLVRAGADRAVIEARFDIGKPVRDLLAEAGIDADDELVLRRVIPAGGKSRYYCNGQLATARLAGRLAEGLFSIAGQHEHQLLLRPAAHLDLLDTVGELGEYRRRLATAYRRWRTVRDERLRLEEKQREREQRADFLRYQCEEIEKAALRPGEDDELGREKERLRAGDRLRRLAFESQRQIDAALADFLHSARKNLEEAARFDGTAEPLATELADCCFRLEDLGMELRRYAEGVDTDPRRLDEVCARLDCVTRLKRKYGPTVEDVLEFLRRGREELAGLERLDDDLARLAREEESAGAELLELARDLRSRRHQAARRLVAAMTDELAALGMADARFEVAFSEDKPLDLDGIGPRGADQPEFLFSANPGEPVRPLARIASGGELSRLLLAMKTILAQRDQVETVIFDEVDAGISGMAAEKVGAKIAALGGHHQVLCITHLPQIAARADWHYLVEKQTDGGRTRTVIRQLDDGERPRLLAAMLDGAAATDRTLAYAHELLDRTRKE